MGGAKTQTEELYSQVGFQIGMMVAEKQAAYGDSFGKSREVMEILYPDGVSLEKLGDCLTVVRIIDKLFRIATDRDALGESPWTDIAGYALLATVRQAGSKAGDQAGDQPGRHEANSRKTGE